MHNIVVVSEWSMYNTQETNAAHWSSRLSSIIIPSRLSPSSYPNLALYSNNVTIYIHSRYFSLCLILITNSIEENTFFCSLVCHTFLHILTSNSLNCTAFLFLPFLVQPTDQLLLIPCIVLHNQILCLFIHSLFWSTYL